MNFRPISLAAFVLLSSLQLFAKSPIKIFCNLKNPVDSTLRFSYFQGAYQPVEKEFYKPIATDKSASFLVESDEAILIRVEHDFRYFELYCEPNDSIVMDFNAEIYPTEIVFSGRGALHNKLLHQFRQNFIPLSNKTLNRNSNTMQGLQFRKYMDKHYAEKWSFYHQFSKIELEQCTDGFRQFMNADIEYWYAYNLMRFYDNHVSLIDEESFYLPNAYFDFLNEITINNDAAFIHPTYLKFLKLYYEFRKEFPDFPYGLAARQVFIKPKDDKAILFSGVDCATETTKFAASAKLLVLDRVSVSGKKQEIQLAYRLKVKTQDGLTGWVKGNHFEQINTLKLLNSKTLFVNNIEINYDKDVVDCFATLDTLGLFGEPNEKKKMYRITKGEPVEYFDESTLDMHSYMHEGESYSSTYTKVQNKYGVIGWTPSAGIKLHYLKRAVSEWKSKVATNSNTAYHNLDYFFYGKALEYVLGWELRNNLWFYGKAKTAEDYQFFKKKCTDAALSEEMSNLYQAEDKRFTLMDSLGAQRSVIILDNRSTSLNKRTNNFELPTDDDSADAALKKAQAAIESKKTNKKKDKVVELISEPVFPEVGYEYRSIIIRGTAKLLKKYQPNITLNTDLVNGSIKRLPFTIQKGKRFWVADTFTYKIDIIEPIRGTLKTKNDEVALWLEPGQTYKAIEWNNKLILDGNGNEAFKYNSIQTALNQRIDTEMETKKHADFAVFKQWVTEKLAEKQNALATFKKENKLTYNYSKTIEFDNEYWYFNQLMQYPDNNPNKIINKEEYYAFLRDVKIQNSRAMLCPEYLKFIHIYLKYNVEVNKQLDLPEKEVARLTYSNRVLKYWQAFDMSRAMNKQGVDEEMVSEIQKYFDDSSFPVVNESLKSAYQTQTLKKEGYKIPNFNFVNYYNNDINLSDLKGKVVIVHFWSANQKEYKKELKKLTSWASTLNNKNVVFLKINTDESPINWRKSVKKYRKDKYHVYLNDKNTYFKNLSEYFDVKEKPLRIVIGKKGVLARNFNTEIVESEFLNFIRAELNKR